MGRGRARILRKSLKGQDQQRLPGNDSAYLQPSLTCGKNAYHSTAEA